MRPRTVLVPLLNLTVAPELLNLAATLLAGAERYLPGSARVVVLAVVGVPAGQPPAEGQAMARAYRAMFGYLPPAASPPGPAADGDAVPGADDGPGGPLPSPLQVPVHRLIKVAGNLDEGIREAVAGESADLLLLHWKGYAHDPEHYFFGQTLDGLLRDPPCNLLLARAPGWAAARRVLLPLRGGPNAELAFDSGLDVASRLNIGVTVLHGVPRAVPTAAGRRGGDAPYLALQERLERAASQASVPIEQELTLDTDVPGQVVRRLLPGDLVLVGAPDRRPHEPLVRSGILAAVLGDADRPVIIARAARSLDLPAYHAQLGSQPTTAPSAERWFVENTYHQDEFANVEKWRAARAQRHTHISVVLPTRNDAARIESLLMGLRHALQLQPGVEIADEILVVDAASEDNTAALAAAQGVPVLRAARRGPADRARGGIPGPAALLREALNLAMGNIVVWLDPKAGKLHPSFVTALAGPLLHDPGVLLVKPFATTAPPDQPAATEDGAADARFAPVSVNDLLDKPLSDLAGLPIYSWVRAFYPHLGALLNPLGNVFAARISLLRELLPALEAHEAEQRAEGEHAALLALRQGFALALVLETASRHGTRAIAQVEMHRRARGHGARPVATADVRLLRQIADVLAVFATLPDMAPNRAAIQRLSNRLLHASA